MTKRHRNAANVLCGAMAIVLGMVSGLCVHPAQGAELKLLPTPKVIKVAGGEMPLTAESRIVATNPKLMPLAKILSGELLAMTQIRMEPIEGEPKAGDIVLTINPKLQADADILTVHGQEVLKTREYAPTISVTDRVAIEGWDYRAVCEGTATLLQAIAVESDKASVPNAKARATNPSNKTGTYCFNCDSSMRPN